MSYHIKRVDPYWMTNPVLWVGVPVGAAIAYFGSRMGASNPQGIAPLIIVFIGGLIATLPVFLSTKPAVSAVLSVLGFVGGFMTFIAFPTDRTVTMSIPMRLLSTVLFTYLYLILMDALVLTGSFLYNLFGAIWGGIHLDIEQAGPEGE